jgi:uncharacterized protein with HEPN domain
LPFKSRDARTHLSDILEAIGHIDAFLDTMNFEQYCRDRKTMSAVERQIQILTEAAVRLGDEASVLCPGLNWAGIRGMGNFLRHEYQQVDDELIWNTVKDELPPMRSPVLAALEKLPS